VNRLNPRRRLRQTGSFPAPAPAAAPEQFEPLEDRRLLSVSIDAQGWTNVTPSADTRTIYVSSSQGSDLNTGLSPDSPFKTIAKGKTLLRSGSPDWLLLKRGDVFSERYGLLNVSGRSPQEPILISAYGDGDRPLLNTRTDNAITTNVTAVNDVAVIGLHFNSNTNDPSSPDFTNTSAGYAFYGVAPLNGFLIEDCLVEHYGTNLLFQSYQGLEQNISVRRNVVVDSTGGRSQGMYVNEVHNILIEENLFDHNGWSEENSGEPSSIYNHNVYMSSHNDGRIVVRGNIFANASSHGLQARSGGIVENNLFLKNPIGMVFGNGTSFTPGGVEGHVSDNVFLDSRDINGSPRGYGIELGNTRPDAGTVLERNIFAHDGQRNFPAIKLSMGNAPDNLSDAVGLNDLTVRDNIVYDWYQGLSTDSEYVPGASGFKALNDLTIEDNDFQSVISTRLLIHGNPYEQLEESFDDNHYWDDSPSSGWFSLRTVTKSFDEWQDSLEPNANRTQRKYRDPNRSVGTYNRSLGGDATSAAFLAEARRQSRQNWRAAYTADGVNDYIREGFTVDASVPTAGLESPDVNTLGGTSHAFIVYYADDNGIDPRTLGDGDVRVTGPNGYSATASLVSVDRAGTTTRAAIYTIPAPDGGWQADDAGLYTVTAASGQVADLKGNFLRSGVIGTFWVRDDVTGPTATAFVPGVFTAGGKSHSFNVTWSDDHAVDVSSLGDGDVVVTGPNGFEQFATLISVDDPTDGTPRVATYSFVAPDGSWDSADTGLYTVTLRPDAVRDTSGNFNAGGVIAKFLVKIDGPSAATTRLSAPTVTSGGGTTHRFTVAYAGDTGNDVVTPDVQVTGPADFSRTATVESVGTTNGGRVKIVTYSVVAPGGVWDAGDNGRYTVTRLAAASAGAQTGTPLPLGPALGSFGVSIARGDFAPPRIVAAGFSAAFDDKVVLHFSENVSASLGTGDFVVQAFGEAALPATRLRLGYDARSNRATLTFAGNGELASGFYRLLLKADGVTDGSGNTLDGNNDGTPGGDFVLLFRKA
jgi:hypothetical protein